MKRKKIVIGLILFLVCSAMVYGAALSKELKQKLENIRTASSVYDRNGQLVGNLYYYRRIWLPIEKIPRNLQNAVIAIEDARFYQHNGVDLKALARIAVKNLIPGGVMEGGSTITQQLAKIALLTNERTISRKIKDMTYAVEIEQVYTKKEILELYLNSAYLAHGNVGVEAASRYYFGKSASSLDLSQSATLAAIIRSPENYSPIKHPKEVKSRRDLVLRKMLEQKYISKAQYQKAISQKITVVGRDETASVAGYFLDYIKDYLIKNEKFTEEQLRFGGYRIYTTLDLSYQKEAERIIQDVPHNLPAKVQPQGALVSLDPKTGAILAMVGGRNYAESQYNRAVKSYRQPGSALKPFVYATALENGLTAATIIEDKPLEIVLPDGKVWSPQNYEHEFLGPLSLREALKNSVNTVAVQLVQRVGVDAVAAQIEKMGIKSLVKQGKVNDLNLAPLALGGLSKGVSPLELAAAYTPFANLGEYAKPMVVTKITDRHGNMLKEYKPETKPVLSPETAYIMTSMMADVVSQGTGWRAKLPDRIAAGKTGTSSDYTNAWFVGYTPEVLTVVWIGNDRQGLPMQYKTGNIGSATAAELWGGYMKRVTAKLPVSQFTEPPGVIWANVDRTTGEAVLGWGNSNTYREVFNEQNMPQSAGYKIWRWFFPDKKGKGEPVEEKEQIDLNVEP